VGGAWLLAQELCGKLAAHAAVSFAAVEEGKSIFESADELCGVDFGAVLGGIVAAFLQGLSPSVAEAHVQERRAAAPQGRRMHYIFCMFLNAKKLNCTINREVSNPTTPAFAMFVGVVFVYYQAGGGCYHPRGD
jgi:hypothetical protein